MTPVIQATDLTKRYGSVAALDHFTLEVPPGSLFGLVGPNGAGKSTVLKILMNILRPDSGTARILGVDSQHLAPADFARLGYVSENQELPDWMSVGYLLAYLKPFYPTWDDARAADLLRQFDLPLDRPLRHLSRGMRMKAALASSLAYRPSLLVLDEPFSGLDPVVRDDLISGILESAEETTILVSSHDLAEIESFASHIAYLDAGRLRFAEEMQTLSARFREIEVLTDTPLPKPWPTTWQRPESANGIVRFVDTCFHPETTPEKIHHHFGTVRNTTITPMPLRAIFLSLARSRGPAV